MGRHRTPCPSLFATEHVRLGVLAGSLIAAVLAAVVLRRRNRAYRQIHLAEQRDDDGDDVPDLSGRNTE